MAVFGGKLWCKQWRTLFTDRSGTVWTLSSLTEDTHNGTVTEVWTAPPESRKRSRPIDVLDHEDEDKDGKGGGKDKDDDTSREKKRARTDPSLINALCLEPVKQETP